MKLNEIQELIRFVARSGAVEVELETKEIKIKIRTSPKGKAETAVLVPATVAAAAPFVQAPVVLPTHTVENGAKDNGHTTTEKKNETASYVTIKSPMIGTFYRSPEPGKPVFVSVGDEIAPGKVLCVIEAMKLFNEIEAEIKGRIVKVLVEDASPVEYDQPLFLVEPA